MKKITVITFLLIISSIIPVISAESIPFHPEWSGDRNIGQEYQFTVNNVSGLADVTYHVTVYDYRIIGTQYNYHSVSWGKWFTQYPDLGKKYLAVWARIESNGTTWYGWGQDRFKLWIGDNTTITPNPVPLQDLSIDYGSSVHRPLVIAELQNITGLKGQLLSREWYGWKESVQMNRQEPGPSAAFDGIILFEIPFETQESDIRVMMWSWYGYGDWYLTQHDNLTQIKPEEKRMIVTIPEMFSIAIRGTYGNSDRSTNDLRRNIRQ